MKIFFRWLKNWFDSTKYKFVVLSNYLKHGAHVKKELKINPQPKLTRNQRNEVRHYFRSFGFGNIRLLWHQFYGGFQNEFSKLFIPQDIFFSYIEMALNRYEYSKLQDKNILDKVFDDVSQPNIIVKNINGFFQADNCLIHKNQAIATIANYDSFIVKPSIDSSGGTNVQKIEFPPNLTSDQKTLIIEKLLDDYNNNFVVQEFLDQSEEMNKLNPTSLNTIRICTYLNNSGVNVLFAVVRFGGQGYCIDNISQGGFYSVINENGTLKEHAYDTWKKTITKTPGGSLLKDFTIPNYAGVVETAKKLHQQVPYFRMISWDIALDINNTPILIESNIFGQSIDFQSVTGPLFKEHTDEVLAIAQEYKKKRPFKRPNKFIKN